jgi:hypothetical protein
MIRRGVVAAWTVIEAAGASALDAYDATDIREVATFYQVGCGEDYAPFTDQKSKLAATWDDAEIAAAKAMYADQDSAPLDFALHPCEAGGMTLEQARGLKRAADRKARAVHNAVMKHR